MAVTRFGLEGYGVRRLGSFFGKTLSAGGGSAPHPVGRITRLSADGYGSRRYGSFAGKATSGPSPGGAHPVGILTRLGAEGFGARRYGSFAGKRAGSVQPAGYRSLLAFWIGGARAVDGTPPPPVITADVASFSVRARSGRMTIGARGPRMTLRVKQ